MWCQRHAGTRARMETICQVQLNAKLKRLDTSAVVLEEMLDVR